MLLVQEYLLTHTLKQLQEEHGVYARVSPHGHKFSLNYDMLEFRPGDKLAEQCRGVVLRVSDFASVKVPNEKGKIVGDGYMGPTEILAYPLDKFYNSSEGYAAAIDWSSPELKVQDKLDGTMCVLYWDDVLNAWCVATRSVPDADLPVDGWPDKTFRKLFMLAVLHTFGVSFTDFTNLLPKSTTFCFELTSPYNRVFVEYKDTRVTLLGVRDNFDKLERDPAEFCRLIKVWMPLPIVWSLSSIEDVQKFVNEMSPLACEGAVAIDQNFNRVKIKNIQWVTSNALKTHISASPRNLMKAVLSGVSDDLTAALPPDIVSKLETLKNKTFMFLHDLDISTKSWIVEAAGDRKAFAELVNLNAKWTAPCFKMYEGKVVSVSAYVKGLVDNNKLSDATVDQLIKFIDPSLTV